MKDIMISVHPEYGDKILSGEKTAELRRRFPDVDEGTKVWLYITKPRAAVEAVAIVGTIDRDAPRHLWGKHKDVLGITSQEYAHYLDGTDEAVVVCLNAVRVLRKSVSLTQLREMETRFHPPQYYRQIPSESQLATHLSESA